MVTLVSTGSALPLEGVGRGVGAVAAGLSLASFLEAARSAFAFALINLFRAFSV